MSRFTPPVLIIAIAVLFASCKPDPTSTNTGGNNNGGNGGNGTGNPPAFGYTLNGVVFNKADHPSETVGFATAGHYSSTNTLNIYLNYTQAGTTHTQNIMLYVFYSAPVPATFVLNDSNDVASIVADSFSYRSFRGGTFTITKFDTVNNLLSGTYHFIAYRGYPTLDSSIRDTVLNGTFTDIPLYEGAYGQGTISANVDGFPMSTKGMSSENSNDNSATAYTAAEYGIFRIEAVSNDNYLIRQISFALASPAVGTFSLGPSNSTNQPTVLYQKYDAHIGSDTEMMYQSGTLTITKFDAATRRMSGTFSISGISIPGGDSIHVTNGVIDNVQWSVF